VFTFFHRKEKKIPLPLLADIHSHLLPGLDDGVTSLEESLDLIRQFKELGYKRLITTPHIMSDTYRNEPSQILAQLNVLKQFLLEKNEAIEISAAAEYYLDEMLLQKVKDNVQLMSFGDKYLLFETNFLNEPYQLKEFIFGITTQGYKPLLAHPERYQYLVNDFEKVEDLRDRNVMFQVNIPSLLGAYSKPIRKLAIRLVEKGWVEFLGSDCHNQFHMNILKDAFGNKHFKRALDLPLLNRML
jgi:tyrosine-protein phosphatase YwqE